MLKLVVDFASQIEHNVLPDAVKQHILKIRKDKPGQLNCEIDKGKQRNSICLAWNDEPVNCIFRELWLQNAQQIQRQGQRQGGNQQAHIRFEVAQQPACDLKIVRLADGFFFVKLFYRRGHYFIADCQLPISDWRSTLIWVLSLCFQMTRS